MKMKIFNFCKRKKQKKNITTPSLNTLLKEVPKTLQQYFESKNNAEQMVINLFFYAETYKTGQKFAEKLEKTAFALTQYKNASGIYEISCTSPTLSATAGNLNSYLKSMYEMATQWKCYLTGWTPAHREHSSDQ